MRKDYTVKTHRISLAAMFAAMTLIVLDLAAILPSGRLSLYFLSSIFIAGLLVEDEPVTALLTFAVVSGLGLLIVPNLLTVLPYVLLFGHYGIGKYFIEKIRDKVTAFILKLLYFDVCLAAIYFLAYGVFAPGLLEALPLWALIAIAQVVFVVYDFLYSKLTLFYVRVIRSKLIRG